MLADLSRQQTQAARDVASATSTQRAAQDSLREAKAAAKIPDDLSVRGFHRIMQGTYIRSGFGVHGLIEALIGVLHGDPVRTALAGGLALAERGYTWAKDSPRLQEAWRTFQPQRYGPEAARFAAQVVGQALSPAPGADAP